MTTEHDVPRVVSASCEIAAEPAQIFELIADPAQQPRWDGNDNLAEAAAGQRIHRVGDVFNMTLTGGAVRETTWLSSTKPAGSPGRPLSLVSGLPGTCGGGNWNRSAHQARGSPRLTTGPT